MFRPNHNRAETVVREIYVDAANKENAAFLAGNRLGLGGTGLVDASLHMEVERQRRV
jgi:hypothetical protein